VTISAREEFVSYLLRCADAVGRERNTAPDAAEGLAAHTRALDSLADVVRDLPGDDDRLRALGTLILRDGYFVPGAGVEHALSQFTGSSSEACDAFLTQLVRVARDDALARARAAGHLPDTRPS